MKEPHEKLISYYNALVSSPSIRLSHVIPNLK